MNYVRNAVVLLCTLPALVFLGFAYVLFAISVPVVNEATSILNKFQNNG